jgi:hypothetical protein
MHRQPAVRRRAAHWAVPIGVVLMVVLSGCSEPEPEPIDAEALLAQASQDRRDHLEEQFPGIDVPDVDRVRTVTPDEWADAQVACLLAEGFEALATDDGGVSVVDMPADQREAYQLASYVCGEKYPLDAVYLAPLSDAQIESIYRYQTTRLVDCLDAKGFEVGSPPSFEVFKESYQDGGVWNPYQDVNVGSNEEWAELNAECPQLPEGLYN